MFLYFQVKRIGNNFLKVRKGGMALPKKYRDQAKAFL